MILHVLLNPAECSCDQHREIDVDQSGRTPVALLVQVTMGWSVVQLRRYESSLSRIRRFYIESECGFPMSVGWRAAYQGPSNGTVTAVGRRTFSSAHGGFDDSVPRHPSAHFMHSISAVSGAVEI